METELWAGMLAMTAALTLGAMSPGPSFLLVARTALAISRPAGLAAALGMGIGGVLFALLALLGLMALLNAVPVLYLALKLCGGGYLLYLGYRIWRGATQPLALDTSPATDGSCWRAFWLGLGTQVSNPKTAIVYTSIFASLLPRDVPVAILVGLPVLIFFIEFIWYSLVTLVLSAPAPRKRYLAAKHYVDRAAGGIMALLGIKLMTQAG